MRPALDRLLAKPRTLCLLRSILDNGLDLNFSCLSRHQRTFRRAYTLGKDGYEGDGIGCQAATCAKCLCRRRKAQHTLRSQMRNISTATSAADAVEESEEERKRSSSVDVQGYAHTGLRLDSEKLPQELKGADRKIDGKADHAKKSKERVLAPWMVGLFNKNDPAARKELALQLLSPENMNRFFGMSLPFTPRDHSKSWDDKFIARLFATRFFSPQSVIILVSAVGVESIGPLSVREMVDHELRICMTSPRILLPESNPRYIGIDELLSLEVRGRLEELKRAGLFIDPSVFTRSILHCALEKRYALLRSLLDSDLHPSVYADTDLLLKLHEEHVRKQDLRGARFLSAIITLFDDNPAREQLNLLLRTRAKYCDLQSILKTLDDMRASKVQVTTQSLVALRRRLLRPRQPGRRPNARKDMTDDLRMTTRILFQLQLDGNFIHPSFWQEILKRTGMFGRIGDLVRLVEWLAEWHGSSKSPEAVVSTISSFEPRDERDNEERRKINSASFSDIQRTALASLHDAQNDGTGRKLAEISKAWKTQTHPAHPIRSILTPLMQKAIIMWAFKHSIADRRTDRSPNQPVSAYWTLGLQILREIRDPLRRNRVYINPVLVRATVVQCLWTLFSPEYRGKKMQNYWIRKISAGSGRTLEDFVREAEYAWGEPLFNINAHVRATLGLMNVTRGLDKEHEGAVHRDVDEAHIRRAKFHLWISIFGHQPIVSRQPRVRINPFAWRRYLEETL